MSEKKPKRRVFIGFTPGGAKRKIKDTRHFCAGGSIEAPRRRAGLVEWRERRRYEDGDDDE